MATEGRYGGKEARPPPVNDYWRRHAELTRLSYDVLRDYFLFRITQEEARYRYALYVKAIADLRRWRSRP